MGAVNEVATRVSPVDEAIEGQDKAITQLHLTITDLEARLGSVLGVPPPAATGPAGASIGNQKAPRNVATMVRCQGEAVDRATERLISLLSRLEV